MFLENVCESWTFLSQHIFDPENGSRTFLRIVGKPLPNYTASHPGWYCSLCKSNQQRKTVCLRSRLSPQLSKTFNVLYGRFIIKFNIRIYLQPAQSTSHYHNYWVIYLKFILILSSTCYLFTLSRLAYSLTLKMEGTFSSETSVDFQRTRRRYIPENRPLHNRCVNLRSCIIAALSRNGV
jgi:hypothetical protein